MVNCKRTINHSIRSDYLPETAIVDFVNSVHPGGANVAFGDGRVELLSENIDLQVYWALGTRQGPLNCDGIRASYIEGVSPGCSSGQEENHDYRSN